MYKVVWRYEVKDQYISQFKEMYRSSGSWVKLFQKSPHFIKTELFKDSDAGHIYITIDYWQSKSAYQEFYTAHQTEIDQLDQFGDGYTAHEEKIGESDH